MSKSLISKLIDIMVDGEYYIAYRKVDDMHKSLLENNNTAQYNVLCPTWKYWYADPILYTDNGSDYVFMEVFDRFKRKGFVGISEFDKKGRLGRPKKIIEDEFHFSFPHVFDYKGDTYMIPESIAGGGLRIYRKGKDIYDWSLYKVLDDIVNCVDTVVYIDDTTDRGKIYLITGRINEDNSAQTGMRMYEIDDWNEMKYHEIVLAKEQLQYSYESRNGGKLIELNDNIYRVIQKSTDSVYGESMKIYRVDQIGSNEYKEMYFKSISLSDMKFIMGLKSSVTTHILGTHTYSLAKKWEVIDVYVAKATIGNIIRNIVCRNKEVIDR